MELYYNRRECENGQEVGSRRREDEDGFVAFRIIPVSAKVTI